MQQLTVLADRSHGVARVGKRGLELLLHRSVSHDDGRGLGSPAEDPTAGRIRLWILLGPLSPRMHARIHRRILAVQAPFVGLQAECAGLAAAECTPSRWRATRRALVRPVSRAPPWPLAIWPRLAAANSTRMLLRVQRPCSAAPGDECGDTSVRQALSTLMAPPFALRILREVALTGGPLPEGGADGAGEVQRKALPNKGIAATRDTSAPARESSRQEPHAVGSQNSAEDGVFISDAALERAHTRRDVAGSARRLLASLPGVKQGSAAKKAAGDFDDLALEVRAFDCDLVSTPMADEALGSGVGSLEQYGQRATVRYDRRARGEVLGAVPLLLLLPLAMGVVMLCLLSRRRCCRRDDHRARANRSARRPY